MDNHSNLDPNIIKQILRNNQIQELLGEINNPGLESTDTKDRNVVIAKEERTTNDSAKEYD